MAATSKHYGDVHIWILKVINSCVNVDQVRSADRLVDYFYKKYPDEWELRRDLIHLCSDKEWEILTKKFEIT